MGICAKHGEHAGLVCPGCYKETQAADAERVRDRAYRRGRDSVADRDAVNPYSDGTPLADAWEEGREHAEEEVSDEFAQYCDPSMRDLYE